jgi:hypothetical protein
MNTQGISMPCIVCGSGHEAILYLSGQPPNLPTCYPLCDNHAYALREILRILINMAPTAPKEAPK